MTGAIFCDTRPAMIIKSAWRGEPRKTSAPKRAMSNRAADIDIISMVQQARPKDIGQRDDLRAQFTALSSLAKISPSKPDESLRAGLTFSIIRNYVTSSRSFQPGRQGHRGEARFRTSGYAPLIRRNRTNKRSLVCWPRLIP